jgi:hypothetical protein
MIVDITAINESKDGNDFTIPEPDIPRKGFLSEKAALDKMLEMGRSRPYRMLILMEAMSFEIYPRLYFKDESLDDEPLDTEREETK